MAAHPHSYTDQELFSRIQQNDEKAFSVLYQRHWKAMLARALARTGSQADAEEIVNDTFVDLWQQRHAIELRHGISTYMAAMVKYKVMAKLAAEKKRLPQASEEEALHVADDSTRQWLGFFEMRQQIEEAVRALPEKCQLVYRLSREEGLSDKQIAEKLQLSPKTVEGHLTSALKKLRNSLSNLLGFLLLLVLLVLIFF